MEPMNFNKGYNKVNVNPSDHPIPPPSTTKRRRRIITISLSVILTVVLCTLIAALIHESLTESDESSQPSVESSDSLRTVCSVTRYPNSCYSSISPLNSPPITDPIRFFNLSLHVSTIQLSTVRNLSDSYSEPALKDCAELIDDSVSQLVKSAELIHVENTLTEGNVGDMKTWISAALTDLETCVDGIEEMNVNGVDEFKAKVRLSQEYVSNALAILSNVRSVYEKLGLAMP